MELTSGIPTLTVNTSYRDSPIIKKLHLCFTSMISFHFPSVLKLRELRNDEAQWIER